MAKTTVGWPISEAALRAVTGPIPHLRAVFDTYRYPVAQVDDGLGDVLGVVHPTQTVDLILLIILHQKVRRGVLIGLALGASDLVETDSGIGELTGSTSTWYCRVSPPVITTCAMPGTASRRRHRLRSATVSRVIRDRRPHRRDRSLSLGGAPDLGQTFAGIRDLGLCDLLGAAGLQELAVGDRAPP
jgi:hypothetical protein